MEIVLSLERELEGIWGQGPSLFFTDSQWPEASDFPSHNLPSGCTAQHGTNGNRAE